MFFNNVDSDHESSSYRQGTRFGIGRGNKKVIKEDDYNNFQNNSNQRNYSKNTYGLDGNDNEDHEYQEYDHKQFQQGSGRVSRNSYDERFSKHGNNGYDGGNSRKLEGGYKGCRSNMQRYDDDNFLGGGGKNDYNEYGGNNRQNTNRYNESNGNRYDDRGNANRHDESYDDDYSRNARGNRNNHGAERNFMSNVDNRSRGDRSREAFDNNDDRDFRRDNNKYDQDDPRPEKPREIYVPPNRFDENTVYNTGVSVGINFSNYNDIKVSTIGENIPPPIETFEEANFRKILYENIERSKYTSPTPVQKYAFSIIMAKRDMMACAQTGSGKTAAFMIPIIHQLLEHSRGPCRSTAIAEPRAVIISPTRELTTQIHLQGQKFANRSVIKCQQLYGATSVEYQLRQLMNGCDILTATPGRLLDFVKRGKVNFSAVEFLVLDEADKMLDQGFSDDIEKIACHESMVPTGERQTLMFSATFPPRIKELASRFLNNYIFFSVGVIGGACTDIEQTVYQVSKRDKRKKLEEILQYESSQNTLAGILVFVDMKRTADFIAAFLSEGNYPTTSIHGDRLQREREEALEDFKSGRMAVLVATAVAARGLDIQNVRHVINYDLPKDIDEYVHRIGRTGRLGNKGKATSFYDDAIDSRIQNDLLRVLATADQELPEWLSTSHVESSSTYERSYIQNVSDVMSANAGGTQPIEDDEDW